jgi:hypothetical protein
MKPLRRSLVVLLAATAFWTASLIVASLTDWDEALGTATVHCTQGGELSSSPHRHKPCDFDSSTTHYEILWVPWPPFTWYSGLLGLVGASLALVLTRVDSRPQDVANSESDELPTA